MVFELMHFHKEGKAGRPLALLLIIFLIIVIGLLIFFSVDKGDKLKSRISQELKSKINFVQQKNVFDSLSVMSRLSGFDRPKRYLVLFLNNTELRPGGGFIGSFATLTLDKGKIVEFNVSGSEHVGKEASEGAFKAPPKDLSAVSGSKYWNFYDANWSPDFPTSASFAVELYKMQSGDTGNIDGVIGFTPDLVSELIKIIGPVQAGGIEFSGENFLDKTQYEVEIGFKERLEERRDRKTILKELSEVLIDKTKNMPPAKWDDIWAAFNKIIETKNLMIAVFDENLQMEVDKLGWAGRVLDKASDYLMVIDSNIASSKSDPAVRRAIDYNLTQVNGEWVGEVKIVYDHQGVYDWRTTKYLSYTKIYVPKGSSLLDARGLKAAQAANTSVDTGEELGKAYFGGYFSVLPQTKHIVKVKYKLPAQFIDKMLEAQEYKLYAQKQLGAYPRYLTVGFNFGRPIKSFNATYGKVENEGIKYVGSTVLDTDREFVIGF